MRVFFVFLLLCLLNTVAGDAICQLVQRERVECQVHRVETADGYRLTLQRLPPPRNQSCPVRLPFVLMHGLIGSAADYVAAGRSAGALAYRLHARCYDVWLPNSRGTTASRQHRRLAANEPAFWQFSWHEIGVYDMPAVLQHVLRVTRARKLHYVGHSQGTTVLLVLLAQRPQFNARIASATLLAPVAYLQHLSSPPLRLLARDLGLLNVAYTPHLTLVVVVAAAAAARTARAAGRRVAGPAGQPASLPCRAAHRAAVHAARLADRRLQRAAAGSCEYARSSSRFSHFPLNMQP